MEDPAQRLAGLSADQRADLLARLGRKLTEERKPAAEIPRRIEDSSPIPLSYQQEQLWFLERLAPSQPTYNVPIAFRLTGPLDLPALRQALEHIVRRHDALRTRFTEVAGVPQQIVDGPQDCQPELVVEDLRGTDPTERQELAHRRLQQDIQRPFDLRTGPLFRSLLLRLGEQEHLLAITMHHICSDGWSSAIVKAELSTCYNAFHEGRQPTLPELAVQYADYASWQREQFGNDVFERQLDYWQEQLAALSTLELPTDRPRPAALSYRSKSVSSTLRPGLLAELRALAASRNASLFMVLMAAYLTVLARYSDAEELVVGTTTTGRDQAELTPLIGYFVNMIVLRTEVGDDPSFLDLLDRVRSTVLEAWRHQQVPFDMVVQRLQPPREPSRNPFFQVALQLLGSETEGIEPALTGLAVESVEVNPDGHPFDMSITASESRDQLRLLLEYSTDLFDEARMRRLLGHLETVLAAVVAAPDTSLSAIQLLTEAELDCLLDTWQGPAAPRFADPVHVQIHDFAVSHPTAIAARLGEQELSFAELDDRSHRLALTLREHGIGHGDIVALFVERGFDLVVGMVGVQKAGAAFVILDITHPALRLEYILEDTAAKVVLTSSELTDRLPAEQGWHRLLFDQALAVDHSGAELVEWADEHSPAYVLYTSGSSGRPKGVLVEHHALSTFVHWLRSLFDFGPGVRLLQHMAPGFDFAVGEFFTSLTFGVTIVFVPEEYRTNPEVIGELLERERINYIGGPPAILGRIPLRAYPDLRYLIGGGEALTGELVNRWNTPQRRFINGYGPTEATIGCSFYECEHRVWSGQPPIGRAMPNRVAYVLGSSNTLQPVGVPGEIVVGGEGLARGYLNLPELTAEKFVLNPFRPGERMYRTGDLGVWTESGQIQFLGRVDNQVKLNGLRIELEEIESALAAHPLVSEATVAVRDGVTGLATLVGYVVPVGSEQPDTEQLRGFLLRELPPYMVPSTFLILDELPLTTVGKVDRNALPAPGTTGDAAKPFVAAETATQRQVADIFQQVLGVPQVGAGDSFFDIGGGSLDAARVLSRITEATGAEISMRDFYASSRVDQVAALLDQLVPADSAAADSADELDSEIAELERRLAEARNRLARRDNPAAQPARRFQPGEHAPLSPAQEQLWFLDRLAPGEPTYNLAVPIRLTGPLDLELAEETLARLLTRHDALRTRIGSDADGPYQVIVEDPPMQLPVTDLSHLAADQREAELERQLRHDARQPFDLGTDLPFRARVIRLGQDEHVLSVVMHHICSDGWSVGVFMQDFAELYDASRHHRTAELPELTLQYAAAAARLREQAQSGEWDAHVDYWVDRLAGSTPLELPTDRPRPPIASNRGALLVYRTPPALREQLHAFSRAEQVSAYATLLTGFAALLQRYSGQDDLLVGTSSSGRDRPELEGLVGFFVNILPLRLDLTGGPTFRQAVRRTMGTLLEGWEHQAAPFEQVVQRLNQPRDPSRNPVFTVSLDMLNANLIDLAVPGLTTEFLDIDPEVSRFDLAINTFDGADGLTFRIEYSTDLFDAERIAAMFGHLEHLLGAGLADPDHQLDTISLLTEAETAQLLAWGDGGTGPAGATDLCRMFAETLDRHPDRVAVRQDGQDCTYQQLAGRVAQLQAELRQAGVRAGDIVPVLLPRGLDEVVAMLAIQHAGAAYLPLALDCPPARLALQLSDAGAQPLVTTSEHAGRLAGLTASPILLDLLAPTEAGRAPEAPPEVDGRSLAYVLYTSGSTGEPKGVLIEHAMVTNYLAWTVDEIGLGAGDRLLHCGAPAFDLAIAEVVSAVCTGATLVIASQDDLDDPAALADLVRRERVTHLFSTPTVVGQLPPGDYPDVRVVMVAGERANPEVINRWTADPDRRVFNLYGPAEVTIACSWFECARGQHYQAEPPIGRMMPNRHCYLLDQAGNLVPAGLPGELVLGGAGVARGYLNRPELTEAAFVPDPFRPDGVLYRSGDLARWNQQGQLEFVGRRDGQVKLHGRRIELGEIEQVLRTHPSVSNAVVAVRDLGTREATLVGYLVTAEPLADPSTLGEYLAEFLPQYLIPTSWLVLAELPRSTDGKLDRSALPDPVLAAGSGARVPARTATEKAIAEVFADLLEVAEIGVGDEFFSIGGNSLQAIRAVSRINEACAVELSVREFYSGASVAGLAALIDQRADQLRLEQEQLLLSVENMTDEEVERLLSGE